MAAIKDRLIEQSVFYFNICGSGFALGQYVRALFYRDYDLAALCAMLVLINVYATLLTKRVAQLPHWLR